MKRARGFTLLELMIAIGVFAVVVSIAFNAVSLLIESDRGNRARQADLQQLQKALLFMERDLHQVIERKQNTGFGSSNAALYKPTDAEAILEFSRAGNPDLGWELRDAEQMRSTLQRVRYVLHDNQLVRESWNLIDHSETEEPVKLPLLSGVKSLKVRFRGDGSSWQDDWAEQPTLPRAIEVTLESENFGEIKRIFLIYL